MSGMPRRKRAADAQWVDEVAVRRVAAGGLDVVGRALTYAEILAVYDLMHRRHGTAVYNVVARIRSHSDDPTLTVAIVEGWVRRRAQQRRKRECQEKTFSTGRVAASVT
jgi:hypothetical protein